MKIRGMILSETKEGVKIMDVERGAQGWTEIDEQNRSGWGVDVMMKDKCNRVRKDHKSDTE